MSFTYEEMLTLTEDQLEAKGVTKGARRKIISNIQKLMNRQRYSVKIGIFTFNHYKQYINRSLLFYVMPQFYIQYSTSNPVDF